jgi:hypothetical protein
MNDRVAVACRFVGVMCDGSVLVRRARRPTVLGHHGERLGLGAWVLRRHVAVGALARSARGS